MTALPDLIQSAQRCANLFRLGRDVEAALSMVDLIDLAMPFITQRPPEDQHHCAQILNAILACQERQDWIGLADWLEGEFVGVLAEA